MERREYFKRKSVLVIGLARSGIASAEALSLVGAKVSVSEINKNEALGQIAKELEQKGIRVELGQHCEELIKQSQLIVLSPGVPNDSIAVIAAKKLNIPIISEIELGFLLCPAPIIAVTGTNGKTTVTTLIGEFLKSKYRKVFVLGNIGVSFCSQVLEVKKDDVVVLEVSSFQLEYIDKFRPKVAVVLNFTPDHLDRHKRLSEYWAAKRRIFLNQSEEDFAVLNFDDMEVKRMALSTKSQVRFFGSNLKNAQRLKEFNHNYLAAFVTGKIFKLDENNMLKIISNFKGVEHRLEFIRTIEGIDFINDSKATNIDSTLWAFDNVNKPIVLIAGGRDKGSNFKSVRDNIKEKVKALVTLGEAAEKIAEAFNDIVTVKKAESLKDAVSIARSSASDGDCILLSPMCASFDMFKNYEERGKIFKQLVREL